MNVKIPTVSILCACYNHENFIRDTINGFLIQKTNFQFEIIAHDDASTDGTKEILIEYETKYPDIFRNIYQSENQYSKKNGYVGRIQFTAAKGKYIAICEGDDYWTDPLKLQKQVDFLENNPEYVLTYHDACVVDENDKLIKESKTISLDQKKNLEREELLKMKVEIFTLTMCFRNVIKRFPKEFYNSSNGDAFLTCLLGEYGKGKYMGDITPACFRLHSQGVWSGRSIPQRLFEMRKTFSLVEKYNKRLFNYELSNHFKKAKINADESYLHYSIEMRDTRHFLYALSYQFFDFKYYCKPKKLIITIKILIKYFFKKLK
jgi:glycosyltransferase involved in cell wall biosynthesis